MLFEEVEDSAQAGAAVAVRSATGQSLVFPPESWETVRRSRYQVAPLTAAFHRSIPSLGFLKWTIEEVGRGWAVTRLPLNVETSNQYITQQAALMLLSADYTGGIALSTLFKDTPIIGFEPQATDSGAYLWGAVASIKWLRPSTDDLICKSRIPERDWDDIAKAFAEGQEVTYKARIKMYSDKGRIAAISEFTYWARHSRSLRKTGSQLETTHHMLTHKLRTSARLIAGLRSWIPSKSVSHDPYASRAAGPQGLAMAEKFSIESPQLGDLVRARTISCDAALRSFGREHSKFLVVNIGAGYDSRPWRMTDLVGAVFVALDLPVMMIDRAEVLPPVGACSHTIINHQYDILCDSLKSVLQEAGAPIDLPTFFIWEGGSMYFEKPELMALLSQIKELMNAASRLWFDFPSAVAVKDMATEPEVKAFMDSMRMIGEPFVHGFDNVEAAISPIGLNTLDIRSAADVLKSDDPVMLHYSFAICKLST